MNISKNLTHVLLLAAVLFGAAQSGEAQIDQLKQSSDKAQRLIYGDAPGRKPAKIARLDRKSVV